MNYFIFDLIANYIGIINCETNFHLKQIESLKNYVESAILQFYFNTKTFSAGGLVTAVCPVVIKGNGLWVGWPGVHLEETGYAIPESDPNDKTPTAGLKSDQVCKCARAELIPCFTETS